MFEAMKIPRKLGLSFLLICASAAVMMVVFCINIAMIRASTEANDRSREIHAKTQTLETAILRQNSQLRGFLVTADKSYLKSYFEARDDFDHTATDLSRMLDDPALRAIEQDASDGVRRWRSNWGDRLIGMVEQGQRDQAEAEVRAAGKAVLVTQPVLQLRQIRDAETAAIARNSARQDTAIFTALITLLVGGIAMIGVAVSLAMMLSRMIARPVTDLTQVMAQLAAGNNGVDVPEAARADELGDMARAVLVFREAAIARLAAESDQQRAVAEIGEALHRLADADLTTRLANLPDSFCQLGIDFNNAMDKLSTALGQVRGSVDTITTGSSEIRMAVDDLSNRSEEQAASLSSSSSALGEVNESVRQGASLAVSASSDMAEARKEAEQGGAVVRQAIAAMNGIDEASKEIAEIISVIDGISFQTNLLALNAGVEAARAGDAGKGFAVVASEVRSLAERSAEAAKDVKTRVLSAIDHVKTGVDLVDETGRSLSRIIDRVGNVSSAIEAIAQSSRTQAGSLDQVHGSILEMDKMTQQNAAMVEETTAAVQMLAREADQLSRAVSVFTVAGAGRTSLQMSPRPEEIPFVARKPRPAPRATGNLAVQMDDWSEF